MDSNEFVTYLEDNGLADIEEIKQDNDYVLIRFYYDFDKEEISAAKSYSNEESDFEVESDEWYKDYYIPYLKDIAVDNVDSILEDLNEEFEVECRVKELGMDSAEGGYFKFVLAVSDELSDIELEDILNDYQE